MAGEQFLRFRAEVVRLARQSFAPAVGQRKRAGEVELAIRAVLTFNRKNHQVRAEHATRCCRRFESFLSLHVARIRGNPWPVLWWLSCGKGSGAGFLGRFGGSLGLIRNHFRIFPRFLGRPSRLCNRMGFGGYLRNGFRFILGNFEVAVSSDFLTVKGVVQFRKGSGLWNAEEMCAALLIHDPSLKLGGDRVREPHLHE